MHTPNIESPVWNCVSEQFVIGVGIHDETALASMSARLRPEHFYSAKHQLVYSTLVDMLHRGFPRDVISISAVLNEKGNLATIGGQQAVHEMYEWYGTSIQYNYHVGKILECAMMRGMEYTLRESLADVQAKHGSPSDLHSEIQQRFAEVAVSFAPAADEHIASVAMRGLGQVSDRCNRPGEIIGLRTGFFQLDAILGGMRPASLCVPAGRPGSGKSSLAGAIAKNVAAAGEAVVIVSLEMSSGEWFDRFLAAEAGVDNRLIANGKCKDRLPEITKATYRIAELPIYIFDSPRTTVAGIAAIARRRQATSGLGLVVADYLQLIAPEDRRAPRIEQVASISHGLKELAKSLNVPVIAMSQLNRSVESRAGNVPMLSDLRESGTIEQDADSVWLLHRPCMYEKDAWPETLAWLDIAKNRHGSTGKINLHFDAPTCWFSTWRDDQHGRAERRGDSTPNSRSTK